MPLTHVCVWDSRMGYRHIDENEAAEMYPLETVPAHSGVFLCELCSQNVGFTKPSKHQVRHFFHTSASQNKECEDRAQSYDRAITSLNQHTMPIRIKVTDDSFVLQLGFFSPSTKESTRPQCQKIKIGGDDHQLFEYAFERIESSGVTYLNIGNIPSAKYWLEYIQPSAELNRFQDGVFQQKPIPEWRVKDFRANDSSGYGEYRRIAAALLTFYGTLPEIRVHSMGDMVEVKLGYRLPPSEEDFFKLYSWPSSFDISVSSPQVFIRKMAKPVYPMFRNQLEQSGYSFLEE